MKKSNVYFSNLIIVLVCFSVGFILNFTTNTYLYTKKINTINQGYLSENAIFFIVKENVPISPTQVSNCLCDNNYLFHIDEDENFIIYSYSSKTNFDIINGRQFTPEDLLTDTPLQMQGIKTSGDSKTSIATLGLKTDSLLDYKKIILPGSSDRVVLSAGTWIIDGINQTNNSYLNLISENDSSQFERITPLKSGLYCNSLDNKTQQQINYLVALCCLLTYIVALVYWNDCLSSLHLMALKLGIAKQNIYWHLAKKHFILALPSIALGFIASTLTNTNSIYSNSKLIIIIYFSSVLLLFATFSFVTFHYLKRNKKGIKK